MTTAIDIVIPTLNAGATLDATLAALPTHTGLAFSTTLCDGGSRYQSKLFNPEFLRAKGLPTPPWLG